MNTYTVVVTVVDYYGYPVYEKSRTTVQAANAAEARKLVTGSTRREQMTYFPRYTVAATREK